MAQFNTLRYIGLIVHRLLAEIMAEKKRKLQQNNRQKIKESINVLVNLETFNELEVFQI